MQKWVLTCVAFRTVDYVATLTNRLRNWPLGMLARHVWEYQDLGQTKNFKFWFIECCKKKNIDMICTTVADLKSSGRKITNNSILLKYL